MLTSFIFDIIHKHTNGLVHLCAIDIKEGRPKDSIFTRRVDEANRWIEDNVALYDLFFSLCTFNDSSSRKAINAKELSCVHADMDFKNYEGGKDRADQLIIDFYNKWRLYPTSIVHSGYGYHVYWVLDSPFLLTSDEGRRQASQTIQIIQKELRADKTKDLARIYRIPSTLNRKYGKEVEAVRIDHPMAKGGEFGWFAFSNIAKKIKKDKLDKDFGVVLSGPPKTDWTRKICFKKIITSEIGEGERNIALTRIAAELQKVGKTKDYITAYMLQLNDRLDPPFSKDTLLRQIDDWWAGGYDFGCNDEYLKKYCSSECEIKKQLYESFDTIEDYSLDGLMEELEGYKGKKIIGLSTEIPKLDEATDGIRGLWVIGGPSKCNKSTFVLDLALKQVLKGSKVLLVDRELSEKVVLTRALSYLWGHNIENEAKKGIVKEDQELQKALSTLKTLQSSFKILSKRCPSQDEIRSIAASVLDESDKTLVIAVDSLNKLDMRVAPTRREAIDSWLLFFEDLAKNGRCPVLLVSEITKASWDNPQAGDFAESRQHDYACSASLLFTKEGERRTLRVVEARNAKGSEIIPFTVPQPFAWKLEEIE